MLEVEELIPGAFTLEVSSPGLERLFFKPAQMSGYMGRTVQVQLFEPQDGCRKFKGELTGVQDNTITLNVDDATLEFDWLTIKKANLVHEF